MDELPMDPINVRLRELGPEFGLGMDLPRIWATGVQTFPSPDGSLIVFREQNMLMDGEETVVLIKNVASILMPTAVLRDFHTQIGTVLAMLDATAPDAE